MTTSRFPFWRTAPAGVAKAGYWPVLTGTLAILFGAPAIGALVEGMLMLASYLGATPPEMIGSMAFLLVVSPLFSWIVLLGAVPASAWAATKGHAGWGVAVLGGALGGLLTTILLNGGRFILHPEVIGFMGIGVILALLYWGSIRFIHPTAIGIPRSNSDTSA
ncbi:hypothetical protein Q4555_15030 [Octadecabacter sp. 1_MG-2023]|uniref:hypothetical protein n=1 Tax=unclassified Octadecabacter TaxID=196158 RepID=UPI001C09C885|nr:MULTISPECIES: hypothetical protein [unclassified Octadecabacter]MBU2992016.1 hypothetical protein [Octadecabacter sp. B2R22]MDO6735991.1 hypothetical protein [Octadecabacter sp. 1_MG-2023]